MSTTVDTPGTLPQAPPAPRGEHAHLDLSRVAQDLQIRKVQVEAVVQLLDEGNTIPFITRYRKERTGGLDEDILRVIQERVANLRHLADRKQTVLRSIEGQGKLTEELRAAILAADNPKRLEDLYLPYKPKKRSLAQAARDKGLDRVAMAIWDADPAVGNLDEFAQTLLSPEAGVNTVEDVLTGAGHVLAELIAEAADVRAVVRAVMWDTGRLVTAKSDKLAEGQGLEYKDYFNFTEPVRQIPPHRVLAINRGEKDNALSVRLEWDEPTGRRVAIERLPLPKKGQPSAEAPPAVEAPPPEAPPAEGAVQPPHHAPRGRGHHAPPPNRTEDLLSHPYRDFLERCLDDGLARLLVPSLEREIRRELTGRAEHHAVTVFARNLRSKLLAAPLRGKRVLAIDPAFRTGCKLAALDETGNPLADAVVFPHPPQNKRAEAKAKIEELARRHQVQVIAIGNGTACRETEELVSELLAEFEHRRHNPTPPEPPAPAPVEATVETPPPAPHNLPSEISNLQSPEGAPAEPVAPSALAEAPAAEAPPPAPPPPPPEPLPEPVAELAYVIVNEAGASVYSASVVGKEEFPHFDATLRGTISIGRRLQDPLSELVKIDPQHVGVGLYQHDVPGKHLRESLEAVIESCVNTVGVDLNTASVPLLRHVSGMNALTAREVVEYRKQHGPFRRREQLKDVPNIGEARFTQAAGFLKIADGEEPLDTTWIHPESYPAARQVLAELGFAPEALADRDKVTELQQKMIGMPLEETSHRLHVGVPTLIDILDSLGRPGRDPRDDLPPPVFKKGILKIEDLQPGMELKGTVLNVVDFGAFIDIGLKDSGLVHISQMANRYVKSPYDVVSVGDVVSVWVLSVDGQRHRVSLTMIAPGTERRPPERRGPPPRRERGEGGPMREGQQGPPREAREPRGDRPPPRGDRPPRGEGAPPRGDRPPPRGDRPPRGERPGQGGQGGRRSTLPPRGTTRLGGGSSRPQGGGRKPPTPQGADAPPAEGAAPAEGLQGASGTRKAPRKGPPAPRLSQGALSGREPLNSFGELAALLAARNKPEEPPPPAPEPPPAQEPPAEPAPPAEAPPPQQQG